MCTGTHASTRASTQCCFSRGLCLKAFSQTQLSKHILLCGCDKLDLLNKCLLFWGSCLWALSTSSRSRRRRRSSSKSSSNSSNKSTGNSSSSSSSRSSSSSSSISSHSSCSSSSNYRRHRSRRVIEATLPRACRLNKFKEQVFFIPKRYWLHGCCSLLCPCLMMAR